MKVSGCAVPEAAEHHRDNQVAIAPPLPVSAATERDIEVVAQPAGERHVPAPPEILDRDGGIGAVEVLREGDAEQQGDADRHIGVAAEIGVNLHGVAVDRQQRLRRAVLPRQREDRIDDRRRDIAGDDHFLEEAEGDQPGRAARLLPVHRLRSPQLRDELRRAHDRPGDEMGEEGEIDGEIEQRGGLDLPFVVSTT